MTTRFILALAFATAACASNVQLFQWQNVNIQGMGYVTGLVVQPEAPYDVYIRTDVGGAYRFDRTSNSWIPLLEAQTTQAGIGCESVAIDPSNPSRAYVVINGVYSVSGGEYNFAGDVLVSEDRGFTWRSTGFVSNNVYQGSNDDYRVESGERLGVNPGNSSIVYFASRRNGLWKGVRQADATYTWAQAGGGLPAWTISPSVDAAGYTFVAFDQAGDTVYTGVHESGVWRSTDGGNTWQSIGGPANPLRGTVAADGTLYVSFGVTSPASGSVSRYQNGQWTDITPGPQTSPYTGITSDPTNAATVMVGQNNMVWRSTNYGGSWTVQTMLMQSNDPLNPGVNPSAPPYYIASAGASSGMAALFIDPSNPKQAWWTNGWGVALTADATVSSPYWAWQMQNLEELVSVQVRVPPKPGGADLISMVEDMIGFRHASRTQVPTVRVNPKGEPLDPYPGLSWQFNEYGQNTYPVPWPQVSMGSSLDYCYTKPDNLAFVGNGEWQSWPAYGYSTDNGMTWTAFASVPSESLSANGVQQTATPIGGQIAMSSTNPLNMIWAPTYGTFDGNSASGQTAPWPHYTLDGGKTWQLCMLANPAAPLPQSWGNLISTYVTPQILAADRADPAGTTFYYFDGTYFYRSTDGGATWATSSATGFPSYIVNVTILSNPLNYGEIWMAFARNGCCGTADVSGNPLYHSTDGGMTFSTVPSLTFADRIGLGLGTIPTMPFLYILGRAAGDTRDAIYKSEDGGQTWLQITNPDVWAADDAVSIEGDMRTANLVYVARGGRGIMYGVLPQPAPAAPAFTAQGVVNGASFANALSPGTVASLFGTNLAPATAAGATYVPLPENLGGVIVTVNDEAAPLWFTSTGQINFQMPWDAPATGTVNVRVYNGLGASGEIAVPVEINAPGIFAYESAQGLDGIVTHADYSLVTQASPAVAGEEIIIWMTGFGGVSTLPITGFPTDPGVLVNGAPAVAVNGASAQLDYAGLTVGAVGLAQIQATLPNPLPAGNPLSLTVSLGGAASQAVNLWVQQ